MRWRFFQAMVAMAVLFANIRFGITDNGYLASVWAGLAAVAATWLVGKALDLRRYGWKAVLSGVGEKSSNHRIADRVSRR
jgi:hypothetical protein